MFRRLPYITLLRRGRRNLRTRRRIAPELRCDWRHAVPAATTIALCSATPTLPCVLLRTLFAILTLTSAWSALAAPGAVVTTEQVRAELVAHAPEGVVAGKPLWLGLKHRAPAALAHLLEEPGRLRPADHAAPGRCPTA